MIGYIILKAKADKYIKTTENVYIFRKDKLYAAKLQGLL